MIVNGPHCAGCVQQAIGQRFVHFSGSDASGLLFVGDSPWIEEIKKGAPFQGPSGRLLDSQLQRAGISRDAVLVTNSMMCKPPFLNWTDKHPDAALAIAHCRPHLDQLIDQIKPKCIVTLGAVAMKRILGVTGLDERQSYIHDSSYGIPVVPTYHPSHILQGNHKLTQCLFFAIQRAAEVVKSGGNWMRLPVDYLIDPPVEVARDYLFGQGSANTNHESNAFGVSFTTEQASESRSPLQMNHWTTRAPVAGFLPRIPLLVTDLETPHSSKLSEEEAENDPSYTIVRIGLSVRSGTALSIPYCEPYISLAKEAVGSAAVNVLWNADGFDLPRMVANGITWQGEIHDGMWCFHWLQSDMLKSLGFVAPFYTDLPAWKHLSGVDLPYYTACDADAEMRCYIGIRADLERIGMWPRFVRHCIRVGEVLRRPHVGRINVDTNKQAVLKQRLIEEREAAMARLQLEVNDSVKKIKVLKTKPRKDAHLYKEVKRQCLCQQVLQDQQLTFPPEVANES